MDSRERIIERISFWKEGAERNRLSRYESVSSSIRAHLSRILTTRKGSVPISDEYGVPDFSNIAGSFESGSNVEIVQAILEAVIRFEPRLVNPKVRSFEDTTELSALRIEISGEIKVNEQRTALQIPALVRANGEVVLV
jgi:type VI secretion system protein